MCIIRVWVVCRFLSPRITTFFMYTGIVLFLNDFSAQIFATLLRDYFRDDNAQPTFTRLATSIFSSLIRNSTLPYVCITIIVFIIHLMDNDVYRKRLKLNSPLWSSPGSRPCTWRGRAAPGIAASGDGAPSARVCRPSRACCAWCSRAGRCRGSEPSAPPATGLYGPVVASPLVVCLPATAKETMRSFIFCSVFLSLSHFFSIDIHTFKQAETNVFNKKVWILVSDRDSFKIKSALGVKV